jgi:hypothetical protein
VAGDGRAAVSGARQDRDPGGDPTPGSATDRAPVENGGHRSSSTTGRVPQILRRNATDPIVAVALFGLALVARHGSLPRDGLTFDDVWVAVGAMKAPVGDLLTVGAHHPGFTALLMGWARLAPGAELLTLPAYVVGAAIVPVLYLVLRRLEASRSVTLLVAALVVVAPAHVYYSGRVKTYVIEALIVLILAASLPLLARRRWTWTTVALWVAASILVGTASAFALVAVAAATVILALHPNGDGRRRWAALCVQGLIQLPYVAVVRSSYDAAEVEDHLEHAYDAYIEPTADPASMVRQVGTHLARVGEAIVDGGRPLTLGITVLALAALGWQARRGPRSLVARYLLFLPALAFAGSLIRRIPFGPTWGNPVFPGPRATLWLLPTLAVGLAFASEFVTRAVRRILPRATLPLSLAFVVLAGAILVRDIDDAPRYFDSGAPTAFDFLEERADDRDVIIVLPTATWSYAAEPGVPVDIRPTPDADVGFVPRLLDPRAWELAPSDWDGSVEQLRERLTGAPRVFILNGFVGYADQVIPRLERGLTSLGYRQLPGMEVSVFKVSLWERPAG